MMEFLTDIVRKSGSPDAMAIEVAKTRRAGAIGMRTGLFCVPRVLRFDQKRGVADFERVDGLVTLTELVRSRDSAVPEALRRVGEALAAVHNELVLPADMRIEFPSQWTALSTENVFLHGDLTASNICLQMPGDRPFIVDWATTAHLDAQPSYGPYCFDLAWFALHLFNITDVRSALRCPAGVLATLFLTAYVRARGIPLDSDLFRTFCDRVWALRQPGFRKRLRQYSWPKRLALLSLQTWIDRKWKNYKPSLPAG